MGLDVSVYKNIRLAKDLENYNFKAFTVHPEWDWKIKNLRNNGYYDGDKQGAGVSYPYGTHSRFRDALCDIIGVKSKSWQGKDFNPAFPFSELCCFADNEGCLDWEVSEKLYNDFVKFNDKAKKKLNNYMYEIYCDWMKIFETAKDNGVVVFH